MDPITMFVAWAVTTLLTLMLAPKPKITKPKAITSFDTPTVSTSRAISVVFGKVRLKDANVAWWGDLKTTAITEKVKTGLFSSDRVTVGYKYAVGMHLALCRGPVDRVVRIEAGEKEIWTGALTANAQIAIDKAQAFGGEEREGGIVGAVDFCFGLPSQAVNDYLQTAMAGAGNPCPAFRGVQALVLRQVYMSANNPYLKTWVVDVVRCPGRDWYAETAEIGDGLANPIHCLRELITSSDWGMGKDAAEINDAGFRAAAEALFAEDFGIGFQWVDQGQVEEVIQTILDTIHATLYRNPMTGQFEINLIRGGYYIPGLDRYGPDRITGIESYGRRTLSEAVTEVQVTYADWDSGKDNVVIAQDIAVLAAVGASVVQSNAYPLVRSETLASRLALRDLTAMGALTSRVKLRLDRAGVAILPGALFRLDWPEYEINGMVLRAVAVDWGSLDSPDVGVEAVQDIYSLPGGSYAGSNPGEWTPNDGAAHPSTEAVVYEAPYWELLWRVSPGDLALLPADYGMILASGARPQADSANFLLYTDADDGAGYVSRDVGAWIAWGTLAADMGYPTDDTGQVTVTLADGDDFDQIAPVRYAIIGTELCSVVSFDEPTLALTIRRGCLDSVARPHAAGTVVWFAGERAARDYTAYSAGDTPTAKLLSQTATETLPIADATAYGVTLAGRWSRPYPPGKLRIEGAAYPTVVGGDVAITWTHRDRVTQGATVYDEAAASVGPESGTTYTLRIYGETGTLLRTESGLTGTNYTYSETNELADNGLGRLSRELRLVFEAARDGVTSWQAHDVTVYRAGWDYDWDNNWG